ncbi:glycoside hydrolase family 16 protein, partial [Sphaerosporella brunnea]
ADCECGYFIKAREVGDHQAVFTEVLESDFTTLKDIRINTDWVPQNWSVDKEDSKGPYGRRTDLNNLKSNPVQSGAPFIQEAGLELWVRKLAPGDEYVGVAEVDTFRTDMLYGSFRASIKTPRVNGTCAAFFWYLNDTQEIDMEFLGRQTNDTYSPVNLVMHSTLSSEYGGDASKTPTYKIVPLPFQANEGFHEYRFDWQPGIVSFYADGQQLTDMADQKYVPNVPGKIILSHWSNGQPLWSGGPPEEDAKMVVSYVKAYFNSSNPVRIKDHHQRCGIAPKEKAVCQIPDQMGPPKYGDVYFFHKDPSGNKVNNQSIFGVSSATGFERLPIWAYFLLFAMIVLPGLPE